MGRSRRPMGTEYLFLKIFQIASNQCWRQLLLGLGLLAAAVFLTELTTPVLQAEPWLSTRYAQNCASCHAPGRKNLQAMDRRCTLSCQGCHVNPNGGGLRSMYGKWNEDRWLRSFRSDLLGNSKLPAPTKRQRYGRQVAGKAVKPSDDAGADSEDKGKVKKRPAKASETEDTEDMNNEAMLSAVHSTDVCAEEPTMLAQKLENAQKSASSEKVEKSDQAEKAPKTQKVENSDAESASEAKEKSTVTASPSPAKRRIRAKNPHSFVRGRGYELVETDIVVPNEKDYLRDGREFEVVDREEWAEQVPERDPYRLMGLTKAEAGADIRWQISQRKIDDGDSATEDESKWSSFLMAADFGVRLRPLYRHLSFVYETRMLGSPLPSQTYEDTLMTGSTRSLYAMVDDLPFNTFIMGGYYRPLFGNYVPDHYTLAQEMTAATITGSSKNYFEMFNAVTIGTAPNVPYLNMHLIQKRIGDKKDKTEGFAANAGLRFVTLGASVNYSYWRTDDKREDVQTAVEMHSFGLAARFGRVVSSLEAISMARDEDTTAFRQGGVITLDTYTQLWREFYYTFNYAKANTNKQLMPGNASQIKTGFRAFLFPGVEALMYYEIADEETKDPATDVVTKTGLNGYGAQLHVFM